MKVYQIFIKGLTAKPMVIDVEDIDEIHHIKEQVFEKTGVNPKSYQLYFKDELLNEKDILANKTIGTEDILEARRNSLKDKE